MELCKVVLQPTHVHAHVHACTNTHVHPSTWTFRHPKRQTGNKSPPWTIPYPHLPPSSQSSHWKSDENPVQSYIRQSAVDWHSDGKGVSLWSGHLWYSISCQGAHRIVTGFWVTKTTCFFQDPCLRISLIGSVWFSFSAVGGSIYFLQNYDGKQHLVV